MKEVQDSISMHVFRVESTYFYFNEVLFKIWCEEKERLGNLLIIQEDYRCQS